MNLEIKVELGYLKFLNLKLYKISRWLQTHSSLTVQAQNFKDNRALNIFSILGYKSFKLFSVEEESNLRMLRDLCPCADQALESMALEMHTYQDQQRKDPSKTSVDQLVANIKEIAYGKIFEYH